MREKTFAQLEAENVGFADTDPHPCLYDKCWLAQTKKCKPSKVCTALF